MKCDYCKKETLVAFEEYSNLVALSFRCLRCMLKKPDISYISETDIMPVIRFLMEKANLTIGEIECELQGI